MELQFKSLKDLEAYLSDTDLIDMEELTEALLTEAEAEEEEERGLENESITQITG